MAIAQALDLDLLGILVVLFLELFLIEAGFGPLNFELHLFSKVNEELHLSDCLLTALIPRDYWICQTVTFLDEGLELWKFQGQVMVLRRGATLNLGLFQLMHSKEDYDSKW